MGKKLRKIHDKIRLNSTNSFYKIKTFLASILIALQKTPLVCHYDLALMQCKSAANEFVTNCVA